MRTSAVVFAILLAGCSRTSQSTESLSGEWKLHWGKAVESLSLTDSNGVLRGSVTLDEKWGGKTFQVSGLRVGQQVEFFYSKKASDGGSPSSVSYLFKGNQEGNRMSGKCTLNIITGPDSTTEDALWIAEREVASR
jgi:hypothetical protein